MNNRRSEDTDSRGSERRQRHWHLERSVSLGHIMTTAAMVVAAFSAWMDMSTRVTQTELSVMHNSELIIRIEKNQEKDHAEWTETVQQINAKLDRLIERHLGQRDPNAQ